MSDELSLAALTATALTEGVKFLYDQAGALLRRRRDRAAEESSLTPAAVTEPHQLPVADPAQVERFESELRALRADLHEYVSGVDPVTTTDEQLLRRANALRRVLEVIHGTPLLFAGEPRESGVVRGRVTAEEVAGYVAAVRAERASGTIEGDVRVGRVESGGEAVGVDLGADRPKR
ncbi:hypothetical protein ACFXOD_26200 [Streptomyces sp. NPDC059161]|uniref:hypothetical protein n=1 Tax=Streptomyces sp. NPDC059161 TaxID=3346749 RepID=UPI0036BE32F6